MIRGLLRRIVGRLRPAVAEEAHTVKEVDIVEEVRAAIERVGYIGDSETMGHGAFAIGYLNALPGSYPSQLAEMLRALGFNVSTASFFGNGGSDDYANYNPAVTLGDGWSPSEGTSLGGHYFKNTDTQEPIGLSADEETTHAIVYWISKGAMSQLIRVNGRLHTIVHGSGSDKIIKTIVPLPQAGGNRVEVVRDRGEANVVAIEFGHSRRDGIQFLNMGWAGATTHEWTRSAYAPDPCWPGNYERLGLHRAYIMLGVNDAHAGIPVDTYRDNLLLLVRRLKSGGTACTIMTPIPFSSDIVPLEVQQGYATAAGEVAIETGSDLIDIFGAFGSYEDGVARGLYRDPVHPNFNGYSLVAGRVLPCFHQVEQIATAPSAA